MCWSRQLVCCGRPLRYMTSQILYSWPFICPVCLSKLRFFVITHYENKPIQIYWKFYHKKNWKFSDKNSDIFHISAQNIDCEYSLEPPRRGGSNEYPQSMFLSRNKKNNVYPCKPQFFYIKWGLRGSTLYRRVFEMEHIPQFLKIYMKVTDGAYMTETSMSCQEHLTHQLFSVLWLCYCPQVSFLLESMYENLRFIISYQRKKKDGQEYCKFSQYYKKVFRSKEEKKHTLHSVII